MRLIALGRSSTDLRTDIMTRNFSTAHPGAPHVRTAFDRQIKARPLPPARDGQPPRPDRRRDRHRQDRHAADAGRGLQRASACRCSWPTSKATSPALQPAGRAVARSSRSGLTSLKLEALAVRGLPGRRSGMCSASRAIRCAPPSPRWARCCSSRMLDLNDTQEGVLDAGVQDRRRQRPAAARPEGPARDAAVRRRQRAAVHHRSTATSRPRASARSSAGCSTLEQQGGDKFFGEPALEHRRPDADRRAGAAWSTSSPPTS